MIGSITRYPGKFVALCCSIMALGGACLIIASMIMPAHVDEPRANELTRMYEEHYLERTDQERRITEQKIVALRTAKWPLLQVGLDMSLTGVAILLFIGWSKLWNAGNARSVTTPKTRFGLLTLSAVAILSLIPAIYFQIEIEHASDDLRPMTDTGHGSFLIFGPPFFIIVCVATTILGRFVLLRNAQLPANLWIWDDEHPGRSLGWSAFSALIIALLAGSILWSIANLPLALPSFLIGV